MRVIDQKLSQIAIEKKTLEASGEELENKIRTFHHLVANLKQGREDVKYLLKGESDKLSLKVEAMLKVLEKKEAPRIKQYLTDFYEKNSDINPTVLRDEMQKVIKDEIVKGFDLFRKDTEQVISTNIQETCNRFTRRSNSIINEFKTAAEILFEVTWNNTNFPLN